MSKNRKVIIIRHGERVDLHFGWSSSSEKGDWMNSCFDSEGKYIRQNLNQPESVPMRKGFPKTFHFDSPLTPVGCLQANLRGQGLREAGLLNDFNIYVSPALRCIQTATNILSGMKIEKELKIEPALFEWTWFQSEYSKTPDLPDWMDTEDLTKAGFKIDSTYQQVIPREKMIKLEKVEDYYARSHELVQHILKTTDKDVVLVGHGFSTEVCSRQLGGFPIRSHDELLELCKVVPYCGMTLMEEEGPGTNKFNILPLPKHLQLTHRATHEFDAKKYYV